MEKDMNRKKQKIEAVNKYLDEYAKFGKSDVKCPFCNTKLEYYQCGTSYEVRCQTSNCLVAVFRGI